MSSATKDVTAALGMGDGDVRQWRSGGAPSSTQRTEPTAQKRGSQPSVPKPEWVPTRESVPTPGWVPKPGSVRIPGLEPALVLTVQTQPTEP